jgi:hypothetical protein
MRVIARFVSTVALCSLCNAFAYPVVAQNYELIQRDATASEKDNPPQLDTANLFTNSLGIINDSYRGTHRYWNSTSDTILDEWLPNLGGRLCTFWQNAPPDLPVTGHFSPFGMELSLNKACGSRERGQQVQSPAQNEPVTPSRAGGLKGNRHRRL